MADSEEGAEAQRNDNGILLGYSTDPEVGGKSGGRCSQRGERPESPISCKGV